MNNDDSINRADAIKALCKAGCGSEYCGISCDDVKAIEDLPSAQPSFPQRHENDHIAEVSKMDCISRAEAIDDLHGKDPSQIWDTADIEVWINGLPPAQPERTCVNCGRTANNGGWYADGRTRCPIEEHYALPKDGYCHLWEKRNITNDDYPERREE